MYSKGSPQYVQIDFHRQVNPQQLRMTFQGGFAGKNCLLLGTVYVGYNGAFMKPLINEGECGTGALLGWYMQQSHPL